MDVMFDNKKAGRKDVKLPFNALAPNVYIYKFWPYYIVVFR